MERGLSSKQMATLGGRKASSAQPTTDAAGEVRGVYLCSMRWDIVSIQCYNDGLVLTIARGHINRDSRVPYDSCHMSMHESVMFQCSTRVVKCKRYWQVLSR